MSEIVDFSFNLSEYNTCEKLSNANAVVYAIKNIILSRPGNFPLTPELGVNIAKYQFDLLDDETIKTIKTDILRQVAKYIPTIDNLVLTVKKVEDIINGQYVTALGINVTATENGEDVDVSYLFTQDGTDVNAYTEINN